jgi:hypothetical protein
MRTAFGLLPLALWACHPVPQGPPRDWAANPAVREVDASAFTVWVCSDVHGGFDRLVTLLRQAGLIDATNAWVGGNQRLYVVGDLIDKAVGGIDVITLLQGLQAQAQAAGGEVVVTLGNHEAEFLADPYSGKSTLFTNELQSAGLDPMEFASGHGLGAWLRDLPVGLKDGDWFFAHAGNTNGLTVDALNEQIRTQIDSQQYASEILLANDSVLEARQWWQDPADDVTLVDRNLAAVGAKHFVFGHDPNGFGTKGSIGQRMQGRMFLIDVGMSPGVDYSKGVLLRLSRVPSVDAEVLFPDGSLLPFYSE